MNLLTCLKQNGVCHSVLKLLMTAIFPFISSNESYGLLIKRFVFYDSARWCCRFIAINVGWPGSVHDACVMAHSSIYKNITESNLLPDKRMMVNEVNIPNWQLCIFSSNLVNAHGTSLTS